MRFDRPIGLIGIKDCMCILLRIDKNERGFISQKRCQLVSIQVCIFHVYQVLQIVIRLKLPFMVISDVNLTIVYSYGVHYPYKIQLQG